MDNPLMFFHSLSHTFASTALRRGEPKILICGTSKIKNSDSQDVFWARSHSRGKCRFASSSLPVRLSIVMNLSAPTGRISVKCYVRDVKEICRTNPYLVQMGQKYHGTLHEDLSTTCWQQHKIAIKSISSSQTVNCLMCLHGRLRYTYIAYLV